ncbi:hypothetical protein PVK06_007482 [Gossypium arboreum]|uniref:Uncharacterized protein n=1 Tax=Gossypium arboreum TaxID=29729 RepID=A0ABR0QHR7_GOSAR|nr:hypothetical protein PVK06_007482 [Gossypium arboreum]
MTNTLYKQLESYKIIKVIQDKLENMFGGQTTFARQSIITSVMNTQQKPGAPIKHHMITLMGYFTEAADNEANLNNNTQVEMVFKSLPEDLSSFRAEYDL